MSCPLCSSGRWRRGWCASATKRFSSNHALKALVPTLCLVVVVIYGLADKLRNFVAGIFIPQYHYPYAVALCFAQVGANLQITLFSKNLEISGKLPTQDISFIDRKACGWFENYLFERFQCVKSSLSSCR